MDNFLHLIFYAKCYLCEEEGDPICRFCLDKLNRISFKNNSARRVISFYEYNDLAKKILQLSKYPPYEFYLLKYLSRITFKKFQKEIKSILNIDDSVVFCPVPLSNLKLYERRFNQAEEISLELSRMLRIPTFELLKRVRNTKPLFDLNKDERQLELRNAFKLNVFFYLVKFFGCKKVVLIDDLCTTFQTLENCQKMLKKGGIEEVYFLTLFAKN